MGTEQLKGHLDLLLLGVLRHGPAHGYALIAELRDRSNQRFDLPEGTVYPALHRLERLGFVRSRWDVVGGRRRRVYELAGAGAQALLDQTAEWESFAAGVTAVLA
jgi:DNA-binding PadR family transcriptional regulator